MKICVFELDSVLGSDLSADALLPFGQVSFYGKPKPEEVAGLIGESEAVLCSKVNITDEIMTACPRLRYIGLTATGYNNIDLAAAHRHGITVTNIPDYSCDAVCQMTLTFLLQFATNLILYDQACRRGDWCRSPLFCFYPYPMMEVKGKTLGLVGLGSIGKKVADVADALGMRVIYTARGKKNVPYEYKSLEDVFRESDFVSLHCPLGDQTEKMVNSKSLQWMKKTSFLINTARGGLVDEVAVAEALKSGRISGYAADCLTVEPMREDCPLRNVDNCILTPHVAWAPFETRERLMGILVENLAAFLRGAPQNTL